VAQGVDTYTIERDGMPLSSLRLYCAKWSEQLGGTEQVCVVGCGGCGCCGVVVCAAVAVWWCAAVAAVWWWCAAVCVWDVLTPAPRLLLPAQEPCTSSTAQRKLPAHIQVHLNDTGELFKYTCKLQAGCKLKTKQLEVAMQHNCLAERAV